jgi:hypothetical protein
MSIITVNQQLPSTIEDLAKFVLIGRDRMAAVRAEIRAIDKLGLASTVYKQKLQEAQDIAEIVLDAEVKMGEMIGAMPKAKNQYESARDTDVPTKIEAIESIGFSKKQAQRLEGMARNPEIVAQAKAEARDEGRIITQGEVLKEIKAKSKSDEIEAAFEAIAEQANKSGQAVIYVCDNKEYEPEGEFDLLLTDPPYMTDVDDLEEFVEDWMTRALRAVKDTGFAYVFIGAYPEELKTYLNYLTPPHITLEQVLVWTYKNTLGNNPKDRYKQNYQACLFFRGSKAPALDCPLTSEQWAVQEINAPDGRQGDRFHKWQKPMEIAERFIRHSTKPGMKVYDPFACTGTFILAAAKLGRIGIGFEIDEANAQIAIDRGCIRGG